MAERQRCIPMSLRSLLAQLREDQAVHGGGWSRPGFQAVAVYRIGVWLRGVHPLARRVIRPFYRVAHIFIRNVYTIELTSEAKVGRRLWIAHQGGIVIHSQSEIGDDCMIRQNVTIGQISQNPPEGERKAPRIGHNVQIGAGAVILGGIDIGDDARIGPNAVVMTDVPAGATAFAPPAKLLRPPAKVDDGPSKDEARG